MKLVVRMHRCEGCGRVTQAGSRLAVSSPSGTMEWCPATGNMARQRVVYFYHRALLALVAGVGALVGRIAG